MKNKTILLTIGIPGSGKSTWAKNKVKYDNTWVRICRDDYRSMLSQAQVLDPKGEKLVTNLVNNAIKTAVKAKCNIIVDQTNVNIKYLNQMVEFCKKYADVEFMIFDIPEKVAIERDKNRDASVGVDVIKRMYKNYLALFDSNFDFSKRKREAHIANNIKWKPNGNLPNAVLVDIDGTIAHMQGKRGTFDWDKVDVDVVDEKIREILNVFKKSNYKIIMITGRDGTSKNLTAEWLCNNKIDFDLLYTKPENDFRKDIITKTEIFNNHIKGKYNVLCCLDDRDQAVTMWRDLGIKCLQVEEGGF